MHHDHIAHLTISYPRSGAKVPLALLMLFYEKDLGCLFHAVQDILYWPVL